MSESTWLKQLFRGRLRQLSADRRETRKAWIRLGLTRLEDRRVLDAGAMVTDLNLGAALVSSVDTAGESGGSGSNVANSSSGGSGFDPLLSSPSGSVAEASPSHSSFAPPAWWHHPWHCASSKISIVDSTLLFRDVRGRDNSLVVFSDDTNLHIIDESGHRIATDIRGAYHHGLNEVLIPLASLADVCEFVVDTDGGSDSLSLDLSGNADSLLAQFDSVYFDAGHSDPSIRGDVLRLVGGNQVDASVTPDAYVTGDGYALLADAGGSTNVYFTDVEAVDVTGMQTASLVVPATPTDSDALVVSDGLDALTSHDAALVVQGAVGGTPIESVHFYDNTQVVIDTAAGGGGLDQVTILGASGDHDNVSLSVEAGDAEHGSEGVVAIVGNVHLAGDLRIEADRVHFDADIIVCGTVELLARDGVQFSGSGSIWAIGAGGVVIDGDVDNQGGGLVTMADGFWVNAGFGTIAVHSDGDVTLGRLVTDNATAQAIRIESTHGGIVDAGDRYGPDIEANATGAVVTILARDQVGGSGSAAIDTKAFSLVVRTADSDMFVEERDQLTGVDINVGAGAVYLSAGGAIYDAIGDSSVDISAASAVLKAVGIGTASDPLETQLARLEVDADDGGIWLENQGDLQIGGASSELSGLAARGSIVLHVIGSLTVEETIVSQGGHIRVSATEDITWDSVIASGGGFVEILADNSILADQHGRIESSAGVRLIADQDLDGAGTIQFAADIVMGRGLTTFHLADADGLFSGSLSGPGGLAKQGPGTLRLTDTSLNTYRGTTEIETGVLVVDGAIGSGVPVGRVTISPEATLSGSGIVNAPIYADAITARIISSGNLQLGDGSQDGFDFAGVFVVGAGHQVMLRDADIAHLGLITTIEQGGVLGVTGDVEVSAGELLAGDGMVQGGVIVLSGGEITPGVDVGTLGTGRLMLHSGAQFTVEIYGATAGSEYDQLRAQGPVSLGGARLNLDGPALDFGTGTVFVLIENTSGLPVAGHFVDASGQVIPEGGRISGNGFKAVVSYSGGQSGNDVTLTVVNRLPFFVLPPSQSPDQNSQRSLGGIFALGADLERARIRRAAAALLMEAESVRAPQSNTLIELQTSDLENTARSQFRVFLRVVDDGLRKEIDRDYELQPTDLADPLSVFHRYKFPNGHYRVYVQEAGSNRERLVLDVHIYDGKVVPAGFRNEGASELPGPSEKELPAPGNPAERESVTPYENGSGKIVEPAAESSRPMQPLAPTKSQDRPVEGDESAGDMTGNESSRLVAVGIGIAQLATVHQWRVRVRDAMNSTGRDVSRVSRLMRRADRRGKSFKRRSL